MPIVLRPDPGEPLCQGDLLWRVPLFVTATDGTAQADLRVKYVLVVSRPCKALRDEHIVIAPIIDYKLDVAALLKGEDPGRLDKCRRVLASQRDGISSTAFSDLMYLGTLEGSTSRFAAQLSTLFTVSVPSDEVARQAWIKDKRIGRIEPDFARDLHVRVTLSFQKLGFDDYRWYCDADLDLIVTAGRTDANRAEAAALSAREALQHKEASGGRVDPAQRKGVEKYEEELRAAKERLQPFLDEQNRRREILSS